MERTEEVEVTEVDGVIKNAQIVDLFGHKVVVGTLVKDGKGRFPEQSEVRTSPIVKGPDALGVVHTRNSVYMCEFADERASQDA